MARDQLALLIRQCLHERIPVEEFREMLDFATKKWNATSRTIVANLLNCAFGFCLENDPLMTAYLQAVLVSSYAHAPDVLSGLIIHWQKSAKKQDSTPSTYPRSLAQMIAELTMMTHSLVMDNKDCRNCIMLSARWLRAFFHIAANPELKHVSDRFGIVVNALHYFLITSMNTVGGVSVLKTLESSEDDSMIVALRQALKESESDFPGISMALLAEAQKYPALAETVNTEIENDQSVAMAALQFEQGLVDAQIVPTRIASYVYLYIKLSRRATIDDTALYTYLSTRYQTSNALMFSDLLFSSFDTLVKPQQAIDSMYQAQCRIYLHNKLPSLLAFIAAIEQIPTEQYLRELWNELQTVGNADATSTAKHFLHICVLHHLISSESVINVTGEDANSTTAKGLFPKQALVDQVKGNAARGPRLVEELTKNDGNAGPIAQAIAEVMHSYCAAKETQHQHLKDMANALIRQPATIDSLGMFVSPAYFLAPFCRLLDEWRWEDIHGESQPIYEEFGSVLLLIMTVKFRLNLRSDELGLASSDGFVAKYLSSGQSEKQLSQMTADEQKHLGEWINNLYFAEGLSDEVTTSCSVKEFYMMIPTLLRQSTIAHSKGKISEDALKGGLDYLLEPFLLPSLLSSFEWLASIAAQDFKTCMMILQVLTKSPSSPEISKLHRTILDIASEIFRRALAKSPNQPQNSELFKLFENEAPFNLKEETKEEDLSKLTSQQDGTLAQMQQALADLMSSPSEGLFHPSLLLDTANLHGSDATIHGLITLLVQFSNNEGFAHLLDVIATIVTLAESSIGLPLRKSLQLKHARLGEIMKKEGDIFTTAMVHFHRRVELYAMIPSSQPPTDDHDLMPMDGVDLGEINLDQLPQSATTDSQKAVPQDHIHQQEQQLSGEDMDQMLNEAANMGNMDDYTQGDDTNMFGIDDYDLTNLEDLDLNMFQ